MCPQLPLPLYAMVRATWRAQDATGARVLSSFTMAPDRGSGERHCGPVAGAMIEAHPMMPVEQQVCSRALAERLAALGVPQESVFWWVERKVTYTGGQAAHAQRTGALAAFTVAELGEMLPDDITIPSKSGKPRAHTHWLRFGRYRATVQRFWCAYPGGTTRTNLEERANTEADARAQMLIYLLENQLIAPPGRRA